MRKIVTLLIQIRKLNKIKAQTNIQYKSRRIFFIKNILNHYEDTPLVYVRFLISNYSTEGSIVSHQLEIYSSFQKQLKECFVMCTSKE